MPSPREELEREKRRLSEAVEAGSVHPDDDEAIRELIAAFDEHEFDTALPIKENGQQESARAPLTLVNWVRRLKKAAGHTRLLEAEPTDLNQFTQHLLREQDLARNTVRTYQDTLRVFYQYHDHLGIDHTDIHTISQEETRVQPTDMLTKDEIHELRHAADHARDLALFDMFLYTGQRSAAIRTLRIKDIDLGGENENGRFRLNSDADGLKGADKHLEWRSLLLAESSVREWINQYHPNPQPDNYLFTSKDRYNKADPTTPLNRGVPNRVFRKLKERTEIDKPLHPHMLRHNFVNLAINHYDMDPHYVKLYIGHSPDSRVMETTYQHLSDADVSNEAEQAFGIQEEEDESPLTPARCPQCDNPLPDTAKACSGCGLIITPDAKSVQDDLEESMWEDKSEAEGEEEAGLEELRAVLKKHPELLEELTDE